MTKRMLAQLDALLLFGYFVLPQQITDQLVFADIVAEVVEALAVRQCVESGE